MFWETFYNLCLMNGTTPNAVCAKLGLSTATATHWKNGSIPKGDALLKIADHFNVSLDYLLGRDVPVQHENLSPKNAELLSKYTALTSEAQQKVNAYIDDLIDNPKYAQNALARYKEAMKNSGQIAAYGGNGVQSINTSHVSSERIKELIKNTKK